MALTITVSELSGWSYASLATSIVTFLINSFFVYRYRSTKSNIIAASASVSALALLISNAILFSYINYGEVQITAVLLLRGISYTFAFYTVFYAFHCIICNANQNDKLVVYIGYLWMAVTISVSIAAAVLLNGDIYYYSYRTLRDSYNILLLVVHSIWGFIGVSLLLYLMNSRHFHPKTGPTMLAFIGLTLIAAITSTVIIYTHIEDQNVADGVMFFLGELTLKAALIIAACCGPTWIQTNSPGNEGSKIEIDGDLEANEEPNTSR